MGDWMDFSMDFSEDVNMEEEEEEDEDDDALSVSNVSFKDEERFKDLSMPVSKVGFFLAEELKKVRSGGESWWKPFVETLPTYEEFQTHHPPAASRKVADGFGG